MANEITARLCSPLFWVWVSLLPTVFPEKMAHASFLPPAVCIVGGGIGGSSVAHFLRTYAPSTPLRISVFEKGSVTGGRMATVAIAGETYEAGASVLHPKNYHAFNFTQLLNLKRKRPRMSENDSSLGIWNGKGFLFKTIKTTSKLPVVRKIVDIANSALLFFRYGFSIIKMQHYVEETVNLFMKYYEDRNIRPTFNTVEEMLSWTGLYNLTTRTLHEELVAVGLSPLLIQELVTVISRINYGQSCEISGLAGLVSLAGSSDGLWAVDGGNQLMASGLINASDVSLHLGEEIRSISQVGEQYELNSTRGQTFICDVAVMAAPLDEQSLEFTPAISIPPRKLQHTHATFVRGLLNPAYFGLKSTSEVPALVGTTEDPAIPFSSISILKQHSDNDFSYKLFSRQEMLDPLLDSIFSLRKETIKIDWAAYPQYRAPEVFVPFILDGRHLYYVNAFENAASTMETSAIAAENVARLIVKRYLSRMTVDSCLAVL